MRQDRIPPFKLAIQVLGYCVDKLTVCGQPIDVMRAKIEVALTILATVRDDETDCDEVIGSLLPIYEYCKKIFPTLEMTQQMLEILEVFKEEKKELNK